MTKEAELLAFLTKKENLPFVIEILKREDRIRYLLFNQFVTELKGYLEGSDGQRSRDWELTVVEESDDDWATVFCWNKKLPRESQFLKVSVEHSAEKDKCQLTLSVQWDNDDAWQNLTAVEELHKHLKSEGFKKGLTWFRYQYIREADSSDEFLASILDEEKKLSLFRQISDCFWPLVQKTQKMVAAANVEIAKVGRKGASEDDE